MDSYPKDALNNASKKEKPLFDINNSLNSTLEENEYCPHIFDHFLNPYMNSIFKKILISAPQQSNSTDKNKNKDKDIIYSHNLSLFQNSFLSHIYWSYPQFLNLYDLFLLKNLSLNHLLYSNPQNLPINAINKDTGCIFTLNFSDTGNIMCASNPKNLEIWDVGKKRLKKIISDHKEIVSDAVFLHGENNNNNFLTGSLDRTIKLYRNFENVHTFYEHNDWVRALNVSYDNNYFLSGCVSSVVKLWDLNKKIVLNTIINQNENQNFMNTVNSLNFFRSNPNLFLIGYRSGDIKICDIRELNSNNNNEIKQINISQSFKAHTQKLNTAKLNQSDRYILTSGRDSTLRLWDVRKIPQEKNISSNNIINNNDYSRNYLNEYKKHKCTGYNVECNYYQDEKYLITGSENGSIIIYDIFNPNKYKEIKTHLKCVNLVKQIPNNSNAIAFAGLAENAVFIYDSSKNITKFYDKENNFSEEENNFIEDDDDIGKDKSQEICNNIIEDIMKEHGDVILKTFHKNNMTYNNGINFANFFQMMQSSGEGNATQQIFQIFLDKIKNEFLNMENKEINKKNKKEKKEEKKETNSPKRNIKCSECELKNNNQYKNYENNIFNCVDKEQMKQLLILPNNFEFNVLNEI